ncbi:2-isopropylmalate synthase [bacterium]|nr:2-isopropylmalate synthase [bacterium]
MQRPQNSSNMPFFYDITLRDGNQSLKKPWNLKEKLIVFENIVNLGINAVEIGFPASSQADFEACRILADKADDKTTVSVLARAHKGDIDKALLALEHAKKPRIHTFITLSPFHMENVLNKKPEVVAQSAIDAVEYTAFNLFKLNKNADIEFSVEHFGDCYDNLDFVIEVLKEIENKGATTINLPNTVERYRPRRILDMIKKVKNALKSTTTISVHNHNDLGMATATTVEAYFEGARQLECCLNGLGERTGNTDFYQVAVALYNSGVDVNINLSKIYETALTISAMSHVKIYEKAPLIGSEALAHRSGIHQDGAIKTKLMEFGAYRPINPVLIGRFDDEKIGFTSQSGKTAIYDIINALKYPITIQESIYLTSFAKQKAQDKGELSPDEILKLYFDKICNIEGDFELISFKPIEKGIFDLFFNYKGERKEVIGEGNGPIDACLNGLKKCGYELRLSHYKQYSLDGDTHGSSARAMSAISVYDKDNNEIIGRAIHTSVVQANVMAIFNALNQIYK